MDHFPVFTVRTVVVFTGDGADALNSMDKAWGSRMRLFIVHNQRRSISSCGCTFGSVSEIQSGWFVLGVNGNFALDADYLSREGPAVNSWAAAVLRKLRGRVVGGAPLPVAVALPVGGAPLPVAVAIRVTNDY